MAQTVWRGHLTFGLVSFPVRLYKAARAEKVSLRRLSRPSAPPPPVCEDEDPDPPPPPRRGQKAAEPIRATAPARPPEPEVFRTQNRTVAPSAPPPAAARGRDEDEDDAGEFTPSSGELV